MEDRDKSIRELRQKLEALILQQNIFQEQIMKIQKDISELDVRERMASRTSFVQTVIESDPSKTHAELKSTPVTAPSPERKIETHLPRQKKKTPVEEFIGTHLLNKIGIGVLVIGIGFGAKYSIDQGLLTPLARIALGYATGIILLLLAHRLKKAYLNFSAVLLSGGMAILYFLTYAAYDFYSLIPQSATFVLMVTYTVFTVFAALRYNKEVIGIIGLTGAYAVPLLLNDGSGHAAILFSYITIINTGILILAFKKYWKMLYYIAFGLTWLTFIAWYTFNFNEEKYFFVSLIFTSVFFLIFYATFLSYKLIRREAFNKTDLVFMLLDSFFCYGYGYLTLDAQKDGDQFLGLFTLYMAFLHFIIFLIIYKRQNQFRDTFYFVAGMALVFLTLAIPVQLDGNWVTLVWASEALLLFQIGHTQGFLPYKRISYPIIFLAFISLLQDWGNTYHKLYLYIQGEANHLPFLLNSTFLTTVWVFISFCFIVWISRRSPSRSSLVPDTAERLFHFVFPLLPLFVIYAGIFKEVETFWNQQYADSAIPLKGQNGDAYQFDEYLLSFKTIGLNYYSAIFALAFSFLQVKVIKDKQARITSLVFNTLVILSFLTSGLFALDQLRSRYLDDPGNSHNYKNIEYILTRYAGFLLIIPLMLVNERYLKAEFFSSAARQAGHIFFHSVVLILLSSELIHWLDMVRIGNNFKLSISILWGAYALLLIILGLWKDRRHIRIMAIVLFGITLIKLFLYDMAEMSTISKTIVMTILGALLLIASFLYNSYKRSRENKIR